MRTHLRSILAVSLTIAVLVPTAQAVVDGYGQDISPSSPDLNAQTEVLGPLADGIQVLRYAEDNNSRPLFALDIDRNGHINGGDLVLSPGAAGHEVGSRYAGSSVPGESTGIDRLAFADDDGDAGYDHGEPLYWSDGGDAVDTSFLRIHGGTPGMVRASEADFGRAATDRPGPVYISFLDSDADGVADDHEALYATFDSAGTLRSGDLMLARQGEAADGGDGGDGGGGGGGQGQPGGYGSMVTTAAADLNNPLARLGALSSRGLYVFDDHACTGDRRIVLDLDDDGVDAGDLLVGSGHGGPAVGSRLDAQQAGSLGEHSDLFAAHLLWTDDDADGTLDSTEPTYFGPAQATAVSPDPAMARINLVPLGYPSVVRATDADLGNPVAAVGSDLFWSDDDGDGLLDHDEGVYLKHPDNSGAQVEPGDTRLFQPAASDAGDGCTPDEQSTSPHYVAGSAAVSPDPVVGETSVIGLQVAHPGSGTVEVAVGVQVHGPDGVTSRFERSLLIAGGASEDVAFEWEPLVAGEHTVDVSIQPAGEPAHHHDNVLTLDVTAADDGEALLLLSASLINVATLAENETRLLAVDVTAHGHDAHRVRLEVVEAHGLTARSASPPVDIPAGSTATLHLEVTGTILDENTTLQNRRILLRAVADNGVSNVEAIDLVTHDGGWSIPGLPVTGTGAALIGAGALAAFFRRRN